MFSDHFYQPLPPRAVLVGHRQPCRRIEETVSTQAAFVREVLERYRYELTSAMNAFGYPAPAGQLPMADACLLYAVLRHAKPARVVEVGSGSSTLVILAALQRNATEHASRCLFTSIDPYVVPRLAAPLDAGVEFRHLAQPLQAVSADIWDGMDVGDVLFVDSSHVFKAGSDVELQFTGIYPRLRAGVLIHLHDIFLPNEYPPDWNLRRFQFWNEQQFLAAVLENSDRYEVVAGSAALFDDDPAFFVDLVPGFDGSYVPGSMWLRVAGTAVGRG